MKLNKLLCRILAKREILLQVAQDFDILRVDGLKSEQKCANIYNIGLANDVELLIFDKEY